jgi:hypothetical protein
MEFIDKGKTITYNQVSPLASNIAIVSDKWSFDLTAAKWVKTTEIEKYLAIPAIGTEKRKFDSSAYSKYDLANKKALAAILIQRGYQVPECDEKFNQADLMAIKDGKEYLFELETSLIYDKVLSSYSTVRIPARKINLKFDFYVAFDHRHENMYIIDRELFNLHKNNLIIQLCRTSTVNKEKEEAVFIAIPKEKVKFYKKNNNKWELEK